MRILAVENLRFLGEGSSAQGKSGPKARPEGVVDGQQVEIPAPDVYKKLKLTQERIPIQEEERLEPQGIVKNE